MRPEFAFHRLNERGQEHAKTIAEAFDTLLNRLDAFGGCEVNCREYTLMRTHLEIACFFAKKAMAIKPANQEPTP